MSRRRWMHVAGLAAATYGLLAWGQAPPPKVGELKSLGQDRYQIGNIVVDKKARAFTAPGRVHLTGKPLEYLATTPGGMKEYETLLEVDATGSEFNLACILVGLERDATQPPYVQFSKEPLLGQRVAIFVAWQDGSQRRKMSAAEAILNADSSVKPESVEWVYTGAPLSRPGGPFAADATGTLIGFVHDPNSVIEAVVGLGIGAYGSVRGNVMLPPVGTPIELTVEVAQVRK